MCSWPRGSRVLLAWPSESVIQEWGEIITAKRSSRTFQSFLDMALLAYSIFRVPLLATICSAVKGLLVYLHRESLHQFLTAPASAANAWSSLAGSMTGGAILFEAIFIISYRLDTKTL